MIDHHTRLMAEIEEQERRAWRDYRWWDKEAALTASHGDCIVSQERREVVVLLARLRRIGIGRTE